MPCKYRSLQQNSWFGQSSMHNRRFYNSLITFGFLKKKPAGEADASKLRTLNYRLLWIIVVLLTNTVALVPLFVIAIADYNATEKAFETDYRLRTARVVSNVYRSLAFLITERQSVLRFISDHFSADEFEDPKLLKELLEGLRRSFSGGFEDIGVIDSNGIQYSYEGPHELKGKDYSEQPWFDKVIQGGTYVSNVFLGFRNQPHLSIAVKKYSAYGSFQIIRTTMSIRLFDHLLLDINLGGRGDAFIINSEGILQSDSRYHGPALSRLRLPVPEYSLSTNVIETRDPSGKPLLVGYRYIDNTPFILMVVKEKMELMKPWHQTRRNLIFFLLASVCCILLVTGGTSLLLVRKLQASDKQRLQSLHQLEYNAKMASIGRLAANVSHEINNPLAIINQKAGLLKDLFEIKKEYADDPRVMSLADAILAAVQRASKITWRLLSFSRHMQTSNEIIDMEALLKEILSFFEKEAELKSVLIRIEKENGIPDIENDRGKIQQIFVNIINNAFEALKKKGELAVRIRKENDRSISVKVSDNGIGISKSDLEHIFEPFFSSKTGRGGTGLGLAITYNLVREIGGRIDVESEEGKGTSFTVTLPIKPEGIEE